MDYDYASYGDNNPLGEPIGNFEPMHIVPNEETADYGGQDVAEVEDDMGRQQADDEYTNSNETAIDSLGHVPDPDNPPEQVYTDVYLN